MKNFDEIIAKLNPYFNRYNKVEEATEAIEVLWETGDILMHEIQSTKINPNRLIRNICGKFYSNEVDKKRSYLTREYLARSIRIRKIFIRKVEIRIQLNNLKSFSCFREAMPFFDNPEYKLSDLEFKKITSLLNSNRSPKEIRAEINLRKKEIKNVKNPRTQKLNELISEKQAFVEFYNLVLRIKKSHNYKNALLDLGINNTTDIGLIAQNLSALAQEGILMRQINIKASNVITNHFNDVLFNLLGNNDERVRRRFRRLVPPERIIRLSDLIYSFTNEKLFLSFKV